MTKEAYGKAYEEGLIRTLRFLLSRGVPPSLAPDMAQLAWVRGFERLSQLRQEEMVVTWINTIALNLSRRSIRKYGYETRAEQAANVADLMLLKCGLAKIDLDRIFKMIPIKHKRILQEELEGLSCAEVAVEKGTTETAVRISRLRARRIAFLAIHQLALDKRVE